MIFKISNRIFYLLVIVAIAAVLLVGYQNALNKQQTAEQQTKYLASHPPSYELTAEDEQILKDHPASIINGCFNDMERGTNIDKCKKYVDYLQDQCKKFSNGLPYCNDAGSFLGMMAISMNYSSS